MTKICKYNEKKSNIWDSLDIMVRDRHRFINIAAYKNNHNKQTTRF